MRLRREEALREIQRRNHSRVDQAPCCVQAHETVWPIQHHPLSDQVRDAVQEEAQRLLHWMSDGKEPFDIQFRGNA